MFIRYGVLPKIILDRDLKFVLVLENVYGRIRSPYNYINSILSINIWIDRETKLN